MCAKLPILQTMGESGVTEVTMTIALRASEECKLFAGRLAKGLLFLCLGGLLSVYVHAAPAHVDEFHGTVEKRSVGALGWHNITPGEQSVKTHFI